MSPITQSTLAEYIASLTPDASPDGASDYLLSYDASAAGLKKVLIDDLPAGAPPEGTGDVVGPEGATAGNIVLFDGATGKLIKDGGPYPALTAPPAPGSFSWLNQQSANLYASSGALFYRQTQHASDWQGVFKSGAGNPFTFTVGMTYADNTYDAHSGIAIMNNGNGKIETLTIDHFYRSVARIRWNSYSSIASAVKAYWVYPSLTWLRIRETVSTRYFEYSMDGINWIELTSEGIADFVTPDRVGFGGYTNTGEINFRVMSFKEE